MYNHLVYGEKNNSTLKGSFLLATCAGAEIIEYSAVIRIEAIGNYSKLFFSPARGGSKTLVVAKVLAHFETLLTGKGFVRLHRSHLVNMSFIRGMRTDKNGYVVLQNSESIAVSKRKKQQVKQSIRAFICDATAHAA